MICFAAESRRTRSLAPIIEVGRLNMIQISNLEAGIMCYELSDEEWTTIRPMSPNKPRGVPRVDDRLARVYESAP